MREREREREWGNSHVYIQYICIHIYIYIYIWVKISIFGAQYHLYVCVCVCVCPCVYGWEISTCGAQYHLEMAKMWMRKVELWTQNFNFERKIWTFGNTVPSKKTLSHTAVKFRWVPFASPLSTPRSVLGVVNCHIYVYCHIYIVCASSASPLSTPPSVLGEIEYCQIELSYILL